MTGKNCAIYVRVSSTKQEREGTSLESQVEKSLTYASELGYSVLPEHIYREVHTGAELAERPQLSALRAAMKAGEFVAVVAYAVDRLSRDQAHVFIIHDEATRVDVKLLFVTEEFETTPVGKVILGLKSFVAEVEREKFRERSTRGSRTRVANGNLAGKSVAPFGYRYADARRTRLEPDPETAPLIRELFDRIASGASIRGMAKDFTERGIPTPRNSPRGWSVAALSHILNNPAYMGTAIAFQETKEKVFDRTRMAWVTKKRPRPDDERVILPEGTITPLVAAETWDAVRSRLTRNKIEAKRRNGSPESFLLRAGFVVCAHCGKRMTAGWYTKGRKTRSKYPVYIAHAISHSGCAKGRANFAVKAEKADAMAWAAVRARLLNSDLLEQEIAAQMATDQIGPLAERVSDVARLVADTERQQANLTGTIAQTDDPDLRGMFLAQLKTLAERKRGLESERAKLETQRAALEADRARVRSLIDYCRDAAANVDEFDYAERRDALALFGIRAIVWEDGRIKIEPRIDPLRDIVTSRGSSP